MKKNTLILFLLSFVFYLNAQSTINITTSGGNYPSEKWVNITTETNGAGTQIWGQGDGTYSNSSGLINVNIDIAPGTYYVNCYDQYSDGWDGTLISVTAYGTVIGDNGGSSPSDSNTNDSSSNWETPDVELEASFEIVVPEPPATAPDCATNFTNTVDTSCGNVDFSVSWDTVIGAGGYLITAGTTSGGNDLTDAEDLGNSTSYSFTAIIDQNYYYTVTPYNANGNAEGCEEQSVTTASEGCYCVSTPTSVDGSGLRTLNLAGTEFASVGTTNEDFTATTVAVSQSTTASLEVTWDTGYTYYTNVWVDFNDDYNFDSTELVATGASSSVLDLSFAVPLSASLGEHRLRLVGNYSSFSSGDPCYSGTWATSIDMTINVTEPPACLPPTGITTSSSATEATVSWTAGDSETAWEYVLQATGTGEPTGAGTATTTNPLSLSGLSSNRAYEIYLRADCGDGFSPWVNTSFVTLAGCGDSVSITYENGFNGVVYSFSAPSGQYASVTAGGQTEGCCDSMWISDGSGNALYGSQASPIGGSLSGTYESTDGTILIYLVSDGSVSDTMTFAFLCYDPPATAPDCATNFTNTVDANCGNEDFIVSWDTVDGAGGYLITAGTTSGGNDLADAVDLDLNATSYAFIAVPGQSYYYIVTPYNLNGNAEGCVEQIITLSSSICTPCDSAVALTPGTQQSGNTVDFGDTFDDSICLGNYSSGDDAIYSYLATEDGETMTVTVDFTSTWGGVAMSLGCPSGDSTAYTCVGSATGSASGVKSFTSDALIAGETYYIHISTYATPQSTAYTLDTVVIAAPACVDPIALEAASITTDSADISWTSGDSSFNIEVVDVTGGGSATGIATYSGVSSPYALTGLLDNNAYIVYVQTDCGADLSEWVSTGFTTLPLPIIPDYTNDFSIFPGDLWSTGSPTGSFSSPWEADGFANDGTTGAAKSNIYFRNNIQVLESPIFDLSGGTYYLNLLAAVTAWNSTNAIAMGSDDSVSVSVSVDGGNYVILHTWNESNNPGPTGTNMPEVDLTAYSSANVRFAITMNDGFIDDNEDYDFFIDDFQITTTSSLGIQEASILQFKYFPSPVNDQLTINAQTNVDNIVVLNMLGQVVSSQSPNSLDCLVDMAAMRAGVYFVQVSIGNNTQTVRVLKK